MALRVLIAVENEQLLAVAQACEKQFSARFDTSVDSGEAPLTRRNASCEIGYNVESSVDDAIVAFDGQAVKNRCRVKLTLNDSAESELHCVTQ